MKKTKIQVTKDDVALNGDGHLLISVKIDLDYLVKLHLEIQTIYEKETTVLALADLYEKTDICLQDQNMYHYFDLKIIDHPLEIDQITFWDLESPSGKAVGKGITF